MDGLMMDDYPLLVRHIAERAETVHGDRALASRTQDGIERSTYREVVRRARRLASALHGLGIRPGDRVATFGWNSIRHLELYLAVPSLGAVLHTLNVRLFEDDLRYVVGHAEDRIVFLDAAALAGSRLVFPGPHMAPAELAELIAAERVTRSAAVPTIWQGMLQLDPPPDLSSLQEIKCGGSAVPEALIRAFDERFGVRIVQGWGMTETSPLAATSRMPPEEDVDEDEGYFLRSCQGKVLPLVEFRIDEENGGELQVRGPWIARAYYGGGGEEKFTDDGWLRTGDVAELRHGSYLRLVDRTKDLVKSGGEWISSVELENSIMAHPDVLEAAVIAVPDERWGERPCACVVPRDGIALDAEKIRGFLQDRVAKWWLPERIEFVDEVPKTSVGKFDKKVLRARYGAA